MKLKIDQEADALYLTLDNAVAVESQEVSPGIIVDYNEEGTVVGIEMLHLSKERRSSTWRSWNLRRFPPHRRLNTDTIPGKDSQHLFFVVLVCMQHGLDPDG
jgi:uncharacterized protein YuzE